MRNRSSADGADWWEPARQRELAKLARRLAGDPAHDADAYLVSVRAVQDPGWIPRRPPAKLPSLWAVAVYWADRGTFAVDLDNPHCFACSAIARPQDSLAPAVRWNRSRGRLDRSHLVTRARGGLDGPQNLVPLCIPCNQLMPVFGIGQAAEAVRWVQDGGIWPVLEERADRRETA